MAAVTAGIAAAGALASAYGAQQAGKNASRAMSAQQSAQQADLDFRREQYNRYMGLYGPTEAKLAQEAQSSQPLDYEQNYAATKQNYSDALRNIGTSMGMRGIAGSGLDVGAQRGAALGQAGALSQTYAQGLINRRNLGLGLTGRGQIQQGAQNLMGGYQNMSGLYGGQANLYNQAAQQGWQGFNQGLGNLGYSLGQFGTTQQPTVAAQTYYQPQTMQPLPPRTDNYQGLNLTPQAVPSLD